MSVFKLNVFITDVFNPEKGETVLVLQDHPHGELKENPEWEKRREMATEWREAFHTLSAQGGFKVMPLLSYNATGGHGKDLPLTAVDPKTGGEHNLEEMIGKSDIIVALTQFSATAPLLAFTKKYPKMRIASMPAVVKDMENSALAADYKKVAAISHKLRECLMDSVGGEVFFATGHKCYFDIRDSLVTADDGMLHSNKTGLRLINLPSGETFCVPRETFHGGESLTKGEIPVKKFGLDETVVLTVENNMITAVKGDGPYAAELKAHFDLDPARKSIAEFGLGCNDKAIIRGIITEDEKAGFHWAYGRSDHIGGKVGVKDFMSPENVVHIDVIYAKNSPIAATSIVLHKKDGSKFEIWDGNWYTV